jgi:hypothetical protein
MNHISAKFLSFEMPPTADIKGNYKLFANKRNYLNHYKVINIVQKSLQCPNCTREECSLLGSVDVIIAVPLKLHVPPLDCVLW